MLPYFYQETPANSQHIQLDETASKHCIQVLRMQVGEDVVLVNGKGKKTRATISIADKKHCTVIVKEVVIEDLLHPHFSLAVALTKNNSRNEWLLEKITELGCYEIYPIISQRCEKQRLKHERLNGILISAMLQSQQSFLPLLHDSISLKDFIKNKINNYTEVEKMIAHCNEGEKKNFLKTLSPSDNLLMLVGPEGDFTKDEVALCMQHNFVPVSLGDKRLRTETAAMYCCTVFNALNDD